MDLVDLWYKYINRFINSDILIEKLKTIDLSKYEQEERKQIKALIQQIQHIKIEVINELDEIENERLAKIDNMIKKLGENTGDEKIDNFRENLYKARKERKDGGKLYETVLSLLGHHALVNEYAHRMNAKETLELITQYISVPCPPKLMQEDFNDLVQVGIEEDAREALWRLAVNYHRKNINFNVIEDYFIEKRDAYYLVELLCAVEEDLDKEKLINKVMDTKDKWFIDAVLEKGKKYGVIEGET